VQRAEAAWLGARLQRIDPLDLSPMLNVGSSTAHFRTTRQPWMDQLVFDPLRALGVVVKHVDMKDGEGVDFTGDLMDPVFVRRLASQGFRSVLCSNVLEHVRDPRQLSRQLPGLVGPGGHVIVTGPLRFPYHPDPIDTGFRPTPDELVGLFPGLEVVAAEEVDCGSFFESLTHGWRELPARIAWVFLPFLRWRGWTGNLHRLTWMGARFSATCVVLRRPVRG
jgi:hypothetical protein